MTCFCHNFIFKIEHLKNEQEHKKCMHGAYRIIAAGASKRRSLTPLAFEQ